MSVSTRRWSWSLPPVVGSEPLPGLDLPLALRCLLQRRGFTTEPAAEAMLNPVDLPDPASHFPDLDKALVRLERSCRLGEAVAICGDYDADGMTSTALLLRALSALGAKPVPAIPSRMEDGYGLNRGMVETLNDQGIRVLVTVDNGVAADEALTCADRLGLEVIVTDHHAIPSHPAPMTALIHPQTTPDGSPYRGLAGVGLAFVVAHALAERLEQPDAILAARDLFCIGTVADMAPLLGANRRWLIDGLKTLHRSPCAGVQALQRLAGLGDQPLSADDIGFQLAPRINAVGRLGDPELVVDLLTATDPTDAMALARQCDDFNRQRRELCDAIEAEATALVEADPGDLPPFLLLAQGHWHHGVIGIVAARLMDRFHRPTALLAGEGNGRLRASVRAPAGFAVDQALQACANHLERFGGHPAAGGFTVEASKVSALHEQLNALAMAWLATQGDGVPVAPDALLNLEEINWKFWTQLKRLEPFGIGHPTPLFWSRDCEVLQSRIVTGGHLSLVVQQGSVQRRGISWRWDPTQPVPERCDLAYRITENSWKGERRLQLDVKAIRHHSSRIGLCYGDKHYVASRASAGELTLSNQEGETLAVPNESGAGDQRLLHPAVIHLVEQARLGLGLTP
ncbi:MAG: single-stranded-DNA-specific exonuclease RecJ [Synechococcus sp.]